MILCSGRQPVACVEAVLWFVFSFEIWCASEARFLWFCWLYSRLRWSSWTINFRAWFNACQSACNGRNKYQAPPPLFILSLLPLPNIVHFSMLHYCKDKNVFWLRQLYILMRLWGVAWSVDFHYIFYSFLGLFLRLFILVFDGGKQHFGFS